MNNISVMHLGKPPLMSSGFSTPELRKEFMDTFERIIGTAIAPKGIVRVPAYDLSIRSCEHLESVCAVLKFTLPDGTPSLETIEDFNKMATALAMKSPFAVQPTYVEKGFFTVYFWFVSDAARKMYEKL